MLHSSEKLHRFCKKRNSTQRANDGSQAAIKGTDHCLAPTFQQKTKPFPSKGDHPTRRWIVLPCSVKCNRFVKFFLQIVYTRGREGPGNGARGARCAS